MEFNHRPVMLHECIENLKIKSDGVYIDGTLGGAGHSSEILKKLGPGGVLIGIDQDAFALEVSGERLKSMASPARLIFANTNFRHMKAVCTENGIEGVDGILMDLGVSSHQLDEAERGFSYQKDAPLDMRMDKRQTLTAEQVVNTYPEDKLASIIRRYGEEKWAARVAHFIAVEREKGAITTTHRLVEIIKAAIPSSARREGPHPAKRTFQAVRIEVNNELGVLEEVIDDAVDILNCEGRLCIITFHSLEDRIVKDKFQQKVNPCTCPPDFPVCVCGRKSTARYTEKKLTLPSNEEVDENPRSRSAKLRVLEKTGHSVNQRVNK